MSLAAAPRNIDPAKVLAMLKAQPGVEDAHDLHIWPMSTTETALTVHLVIPKGHPGDAFLSALRKELHAHFGIDHPTVQIEIDRDCPFAPDHVV